MSKSSLLAVIRMLASFLILGLFLSSYPYGKTVGFVLFLFFFTITRTQLFNIRKSPNVVFLHSMADRILLATAFISFVRLDLMPAWMAVIVIGSEFVTACRDLLFATEKKDGFSKEDRNLIYFIYFLCITTVLLILSFCEIVPHLEITQRGALLTAVNIVLVFSMVVACISIYLSLLGNYTMSFLKGEN